MEKRERDEYELAERARRLAAEQEAFISMKGARAQASERANARALADQPIIALRKVEEGKAEDHTEDGQQDPEAPADT